MTLARTTWRRIFWLVMMAGHAPALLLAWRGCASDDGSVLRVVVLAGSEIVFLLKLIDVRWLRTSGGWRANLAVTVAVVLLHAGVLRHLAVRGIDNPNAWCVLFVGSGSTAVGLLVGRRRSTTVRRRPLAPRPQPRLTGPARWADDLLPPRYLLLIRSFSINRAPPVPAVTF